MNAFDDDPFGPVVANPPFAAPAKPGKPAKVVVQPPPIAYGSAEVVARTFRATLPYPPSANEYWRFRTITPKGKPSFVSMHVSHAGKQFKDSAGWLLKAAGIKQPIAGRVRVDLQLWPNRPQDWATRMRKDPLYWADTVQRLDLDNCRKAVYDALKEIAFGDDKCVWQDSGEVMEPDGRDACVVVTITQLVKHHPQEALL